MEIFSTKKEIFPQRKFLKSWDTDIPDSVWISKSSASSKSFLTIFGIIFNPFTPFNPYAEIY